MKKILLTSIALCGLYSISSAQGHCRTGDASKRNNNDGTATISCSPSNNTCYETDKTGIVASGHYIDVHINGGIERYIVASTQIPNPPPATPPGTSCTPYDALPNVVTVIAER